jgi:hypothetical protein
MKEFPKLNAKQVAVMRAEVNTGIILDEKLDIAIDDSQNVYTVFESVEEAIYFSNKLLAEKPNIEIVIYGSKEEVLHFLTI